MDKIENIENRLSREYRQHIPFQLLEQYDKDLHDIHAEVKKLRIDCNKLGVKYADSVDIIIDAATHIKNAVERGINNKNSIAFMASMRDRSMRMAGMRNVTPEQIAAKAIEFDHDLSKLMRWMKGEEVV